MGLHCVYLVYCYNRQFGNSKSAKVRLISGTERLLFPLSRCYLSYFVRKWVLFTAGFHLLSSYLSFQSISTWNGSPRACSERCPRPQPNFPLIQQSIQEIANEVAKLENVLPAYLQKNQQDQILILQQLGALTNSVNLLLTGVTACQARYPFFSSFYFFWLTQLPTALVDYQCYFSMPLHLTKLRSCTPQTSLLPPTLRQRKRLQSLLVG